MNEDPEFCQSSFLFLPSRTLSGAEGEAFADFFAYAITKELAMGLYSDRQSGELRVIRWVKSSLNSLEALRLNRSWGFELESVDRYEAAAKLRDALVLVMDEFDFETSLETFRLAMRLKKEFYLADPAPAGSEKNSRVAEKAYTEAFARRWSGNIK